MGRAGEARGVLEVGEEGGARARLAGQRLVRQLAPGEAEVLLHLPDPLGGDAVEDKAEAGDVTLGDDHEELGVGWTLGGREGGREGRGGGGGGEKEMTRFVYGK